MTSKMSAIYYNWSVSGAKKNMFSILAIPFYLVILKRRTRSLRQEEGVSCHYKVYFVVWTQNKTFWQVTKSAK